jgi:dihydrofolate reductase
LSLNTSVFIATSLDGFIARPDGSIDWLIQANAAVPKGEDCGYKAFMDTVDILVMGRNTFEQVLSFDEWPYSDKRVIVLTRKGVEIPAALRQTVSATSEPPAMLAKRLESEGAQHLYIDGGQTIQSFLSAGLINELTITIIPILLGAGRPLFGPIKSDIALIHLSTQAYPFGFVQSKYRVVKETAP